MGLLTSTLRVGTILLTIPLLLTAVAHGPGRGISLIPPGEWWTTPIALLEIFALGMLLAGAFMVANRSASILLLGTGLICRAIFEIRISLLKFLWPFEGLNGLSIAWIAFYYLGAFLFPALLFCELRRAHNGRVNTPTTRGANKALDTKT